MKTSSKTISVVALLVGTATCSFGALKPCGFMTDGKESRFVFADTESGKRYTWIAVGQSFWDYSVVGFDQKQEILLIRRGREIIPLGLKTTNVIDVGKQAAAKPVIISIAGYAPIFVTDDPALLPALNEKLSDIARTVPPPTVTIRAPKDAEISRVRAVAKLVRTSGLTRINFAMGQTNEKVGVLLK